MVCKKSLYCWKNGPCASDQTRKQIWEDNIKFRESLRDINQSDHYWSFQILKNRCLCLEGEELLFKRPLSRTYHSGSSQKLHHQIDCTSITHDFNGLKFRNCFVHCPIHDFSKSAEGKQSDNNIYTKENSYTCSKYFLQPLKTSGGSKTEYCQRYKKTLTSSNLKPSMKIKFSSQSNVNQLNENKNLLGRKSLYSSYENIPSAIQEIKLDSTKIKNQGVYVNKSINCNLKVCNNESHAEHKTKKEKKVKIKKLNQESTAKFLNPIVMHEYPPISRTTRKMLRENKKVPFITYGCNNNSLDVSSKRTHNVLAPKLEVYPSALSAKQQKKDLILKCIQSEKEFQKYIPDFKRKLVNHSSLWSVDPIGRGEIGSQKKISKQILPIKSKSMKKPSNQFNSSYNGCQKPQLFFY